MSLAQKYSALERPVSGNTARVLAPEIRAPHPRSRTVARPKKAIGGTIVFVAVIWSMVMGISLVAVWRNSIVQQETSSITRAKDDLAMLRQQNRELEDQLVKATAATTIQDWAMSKGMQRPTAFRTISQDPNAVAVRPALEQTVQSDVARGGFWTSVRTTLARVFGGKVQTAEGHK